MKVKELSELEEAVMGIIWRLEECSVREIKGELDHSKKLAYTTIATIVQRLQKKGMLTRTNRGSFIVYAPKVSKEIYSKSLAASFIDHFHHSFGDIALVSFAESLENLSKDKRSFLLKLLEEHENK